MNEPPLPEDLSQWPANPFRLLGVAPGVSPHDLRRAYTRLIRVYKPEQFPEQFRRIREAYETVLEFAEYHLSADSSSEAPAAGIDQPGPPSEPPNDPLAVPEPRLHSLEEELHDLWAQAVAGEEELAYRELVALAERHPGRAEICVRLYWLLALTPDLDARPPCDWLVRGLLANGFTGPLRVLYRRELEENPAEAVGAPSDQLVAGSVPESGLLDLLDWRWRAVARLGRWDVLTRDLESVGERSDPTQEDQWLRVVLLAAERLVWEDDEAPAHVFQRCLVEFQEAEDAATRNAELFNRVDYLREAAAGWQNLRDAGDTPPCFLDLIPRSWQSPFGAMRPLLLEVLEQIAANPYDWLQHFDAIHLHASAALAQLGQLLAQMEMHQEPSSAEQRPPEVLHHLVVVRFLRRSQAVTSYLGLRADLLRFCLEEAVRPEQVAAVAGDLIVHWPRNGCSLGQAIHSDWPLRCVCWAHRVFWA